MLNSGIRKLRLVSAKKNILMNGVSLPSTLIDFSIMYLILLRIVVLPVILFRTDVIVST